MQATESEGSNTNCGDVIVINVFCRSLGHSHCWELLCVTALSLYKYLFLHGSAQESTTTVSFPNQESQCCCCASYDIRAWTRKQRSSGPTCTDAAPSDSSSAAYLGTMRTFILTVSLYIAHFFFYLQTSRALWGRRWHNSGTSEKCEGLREVPPRFAAPDLPVWILRVLGERHHL